MGVSFTFGAGTASSSLEESLISRALGCASISRRRWRFGGCLPFGHTQHVSRGSRRGGGVAAQETYGAADGEGLRCGGTNAMR